MEKIPCKQNHYNSHKDSIGKISDNHIKRQFHAKSAYQKCYTDVTRFKLVNSDKVRLLSELIKYTKYLCIDYSSTLLDATAVIWRKKLI